MPKIEIQIYGRNRMKFEKQFPSIPHIGYDHGVHLAYFIVSSNKQFAHVKKTLPKGMQILSFTNLE